MSIHKVEDSLVKGQEKMGFTFGGTQAAKETSKLVSPEAAAHMFMTNQTRLIREGAFKGMYDLFQKSDGPERFREMSAYISGRTVYMPTKIDQKWTLCPAVITTLGSGEVRLVVLRSRARLDSAYQLVPDQLLLLSGAMQSEAQSIGQHNQASASAEAGHMLTIMAGALQPARAQAIANGDHVVHGLKEQSINLVSAFTQPSEGQPLFPSRIEASTFSYDNWPTSARLLLPTQVERTESVAMPEAMPLLQGLGYLSLVEAGRVDTARRLAEAMG